MMIIRCDRCNEEYEKTLKASTITLTAFDEKCNKLDLCKKCQEEIRKFIYGADEREDNDE